MMLKRVEDILRDARILGLATEYGEGHGIQDDFLLIQLNSAKYELQRAVVATNSEVFVGYYEIDCDGSVSYSMPSDALANNLLYEVHYSRSGLATDYYPLSLVFERPTGKSGTPQSYCLDADLIYPDYLPTSGKLRLKYEKNLYNLDKRRGRVSAYTNSGDEIQTITLVDSGSVLPDDTNLPLAEYVCVSDRTGNMAIRNIPVDSYDATLHRITVVSGWSAPAGWAFPSPAYITIGADTITHPQGTLAFEQFYTEYLRWEIEKQRSSLDASEANKKLNSILSSIVDLYDQLPAGRTIVGETRRD